MIPRKFRTKDGTLTAYAFACGYVLTKRALIGGRVRLWQEHGTFHVRAVDADGRRIFWAAFGKLTEARRAFRMA